MSTATMAAPAAAKKGSTLAKTGMLTKAVFRRDRIRMIVWAVVVWGLLASIVNGVQSVYKTQADFQSRAKIMRTATGVIFGGPGFGTDHYNLGTMAANEEFMMFAIVIAIMSITLVIRGTRAEEESGRSELVGAASTGRHAGLASALISVTILNLVIGILVGATLSAEIPSTFGVTNIMASSITYGLGFALVGITFGLIGAVAAQIMQTSRGATGVAMATLGALYMFRLVGDMLHMPTTAQTDATPMVTNPGSAWPSWLSPLSWTQQTKMYTSAFTPWPLLIFIPVIAGLLIIAITLAARRDVGAGLIAQRDGKPSAAPRLRSAFALAWRLQRGLWYGWGVGIVILAAAMGPLASSIKPMVQGNSAMQKVIAGRGGGDPIVDGFIYIILLYIAICVACPALMAMGHLLKEQNGGTGEVLLAGPTSRKTLIGSQLCQAMLGAAALQIIGSAVVAATAAPTGAISFGRAFGAGLAYLPAVVLYAPISAFLFAWAPKAQQAAWLFISWSIIAALFGPMWKLPQWAISLGPISATPQVPASPMTWTPLIVMAAFAALLSWLALTGIKQRDYVAS